MASRWPVRPLKTVDFPTLGRPTIETVGFIKKMYIKRSQRYAFFCFNMLETFYNTFGFIGSLAVAYLAFFFFLFWIAGLSGICRMRDSERAKQIRIVIAVLVPPYPFFWMIREMISQKKDMRNI